MRKTIFQLCFLLSLCLLILSSIAFAEDATTKPTQPGDVSDSASRPLRLARVPLIVRSSYAGADVQEMLEDRLDLALHVPLNDTMHYVEELPQSEVEEALQDVLAELSQGKKRVKIKDAMQPLAEKLDADLVVCPVLTDYYEIVFYGGWDGWNSGDTIRLESFAGLELNGYDRAENFSKATSRFYHDSYSSYGRASYLAKDALESLIQETDVNRRVTRTLRERAAASRTDEATAESAAPSKTAESTETTKTTETT